MEQYISYYNIKNRGKFNKGWYIFSAELIGEKIIIHKNINTHSSKSRNEALEKFAKLRLKITTPTIHHVGLSCLDYRFDSQDILPAA